MHVEPDDDPDVNDGAADRGQYRHRARGAFAGDLLTGVPPPGPGVVRGGLVVVEPGGVAVLEVGPLLGGPRSQV